MCSIEHVFPNDRLHPHPGFRIARSAAGPAGAGLASRRACAPSRHGAAPGAGDRSRGSGRHTAGNAPGRGAGDVSLARARRPGSCGCRARVGGDPPPARGRRLRGGARGARHPLPRHARGGAAVRRPGEGAQAGARRSRPGVGSPRRCRQDALHRTRRGQHRPARPGRSGGRGPHPRVSRTALAPPGAASRRTAGGAARAGHPAARRFRRAAGARSP